MAQTVCEMDRYVSVEALYMSFAKKNITIGIPDARSFTGPL